MSTLTVIKTKNDTAWEWQAIIGAGIFATGLAQPEVLHLPFRRLLLEDYHADAEKMVLFFWIVSLPWSLKVIAGLLLDTVPLFGTRRYYYLIFSAVCASILWLLLNFAQFSFFALAATGLAINVFLVIASSAGGALYVEGGERLNLMDRLASTRVFADNVSTFVAGPLSGWLAHAAFSVFAFVGALIPLSLLPPVIRLLKEPPTAKYEGSVLRDAWKNIGIVVASGQAWIAGLYLCLVSMSQSFPSALIVHQIKDLGFSYLAVGLLDSLAAVGGMLATVVYGLLRRFQHLRMWLMVGILCGSMDAFIYSFYSSLAHAYWISPTHGFLVTLSVLAMMEVAGLATPTASTALGFAFVASAWNTGIPLGDYIFARIMKLGFDFYHVTIFYAAICPFMIGAIFLLPKAIQMKK